MRRLRTWWLNRRVRRITRANLVILGGLHEGGHTYWQLHTMTGWGSGRIYPILARLEAGGQIWSKADERGRRRYFLVGCYR